MKCFSWVDSAVQALSNDSKARQGKDDHLELTPQQIQEGDGIKITQVEVQPPKVASLPSRIKLAGDSTPRGFMADIWNDPAPASEPIPDPGEQPISPGNVPIRTSNKLTGKPSETMASTKEPLHDSSLAFDYDLAVVDYVPSGHAQNPRSLGGRNMSSTSTIFKNSPLAAITIIVTTPEEPSPPETPTPTSQSQNTFNQIRVHRQATSLPSSQRPSLSTLPIPESNLLKPPTERQINASKLRKAREFREIRKFLINFMTAKGDQFSKKLRTGMMEMYCITEADLSPETVAKFNEETKDKDEGVALEQLGMEEEERTDADDLKILEMAFRSQIPVVTPTREQALVDCIPPPRTTERKQSLIERREARENGCNWLDPIITTNTKTPLAAPPLDSPPPRPAGKEHKLLRFSSVPNMYLLKESDREGAPPVPTIPFSYSNSATTLVKKRGRNRTLSAGSEAGSRAGSEMREMPMPMPIPMDARLRVKLMEQQQKRKRNLFSDAFGTLRGKITGRAVEKRRLELETAV